MSDGDVSLIRDEDLLRRMWQQTEDFSRKKEIRAHMYRLREERLRNLYSPEPSADGKGCEFTSTHGHVKSFADQSFQSMKSKEVRDAGSPPKEFTYRGQDLKDLSNAGWNVESENRTSDDGHTHVKSVHANIQGRYDVDGGKGQFTAADHHKNAVTEYDDGNTSLKRNEDYSNTSAHDQVVRNTDDGTHFSSTTSSSTSTSKFQQVSSKHETVPYLTEDNYDLATQKSYDTNRNEELISNRITKTNNYEQNLRNDNEQGELVSRKIDYPDDNTKVIVETRCLPDGTRITSTRREFRAPSVQTSRSEHHSQQVRNESKSTSFTTSQKRSETNESSTKIIRDSIEDNVQNIVDSQRIQDDFDFRKEHVNKYNNVLQEEKINKSKINERDQREFVSSYDNQNTRNQDVKETRYYKETNDRNHKTTQDQNVDEVNKNKERIINERNVHEVRSSYDDQNIRKHNIEETRYYDDNKEHVHHITRERDVPDTVKPDETIVNERDHREVLTSYNDRNIHNQDKIKETRYHKDSEERIHNISTKDRDVKENIEKKKTTDQYQTTYQTDYTQRKISNEWSPTHQAWASTLRSDTPSRPTTRASSPGSKTFKSSDSSLRSSLSPDKNYRKTPSRGGSPSKIDRNSPSRTTFDKYSSTQSSSYSIHDTKTNKYSSFDKTSPKSNSPTRNSPERKPQDGSRNRPSVSPEKQAKVPSSRPSDGPQAQTSKSPIRSSPSPNRKYHPKERTSPTPQTCMPETDEFYSIHENTDRNKTTTQNKFTEKSSRTTTTTTHLNENIDTSSTEINKTPFKPSESFERQPGYMKHTASSSPRTDRSPSPTKPHDSKRKSPTKHVSSESPERKQSDTKLFKVTEEHQNFINEERKINTSYDESVINKVRDTSPSQTKSPHRETTTSQPQSFKDSPQRKSSVSPDRNLSNIRKSPPKNTRETSPMTRDTSDNLDKYPKNNRKSPGKDLSKDMQPKLNDDSTKTDRQPSREASPVKREMSPDKYYSRPKENASHPSIKDLSPTRKLPTKENTKNVAKVTEKTSIKTTNLVQNIENIKDMTCEKQNIQEEYVNINDNRTDTNKHSKTDTITTTQIKSTSDQETPSSLPSRSAPRSVSPTKPITKEDTKYKQTSEFIRMEKTSEETNKRTDRSRKLVTPSTSPTRKPKPDETAPSTGQSSPTTTASGFVYFSSPQVEKPQVTDLDDKEPTYTNIPKKYPTDIVLQKEPSRRTPSPTKIPCRSPSPEKTIIKENLPRKSSLKKPSIDNTNATPSEKPPTSFLITPNDEKSDKKDTPIKKKPPLERRETYEERCKKILGMTNEDITTETKSTTDHSRKSISSDTSPSISPCESPIQFEDKHFSNDKYETVDVLDKSEQTIHTGIHKTPPKQDNKLPSNDINPKEITVARTAEKKNIATLSDITTTKKTTLEKKSPLESQPTNKSTVPKSEYKEKDRRSVSKSPQRKPSSISPDRTSLADSRNSPEKTNDIDKDNNNRNIADIVASKSEITNIHDKQNIQSLDETLYKQGIHKTVEDRKITEVSSDFIISEREQQILDRVQSSLRKLSPDRKQQKQPIREKSPEKPIYKSETNDAVTISEEKIEERCDKVDNTTKIFSEEKTTLKKNVTNDKPGNKSQIPSKPSSRNVSPNKKSPNSPNLPKTVPDTGKVRSSSPKKPMSPIDKKPGSPIDKKPGSPIDKKPGSPIERPHSPQVPKTLVKKEPVSPQYQRTSSASTIKNEKTNVTDIRKTTIVKQQSITKILQPKIGATKASPSIKPAEVEPKRAQPLKGKNVDTKVTRTTSDIAMKSPLHKKVAPQRMKSKPEIQVTNAISNRVTKQSNIKHQKSSPKESPTKLPVTKPKSAIDLNTSTDDDDIIIDVRQAKSSRENSPDRICPTPVGFSEDMGTPRFPDEVNEPDDEFIKRTHHVIHETESIVDDIVEICEDDELFVRRSATEFLDKKDESSLSVNDKVSKFTKKIETVKPKDTTTRFKDTEIKKHSDFVDDNLKSDECLLSVSEKVNKFAKGQTGPKDKSPSRNIVEEYDRDTIYQDDYTKLSVNDKAHLFIETAENVKTTKPKTVHKPERPDFSDVDESLKSDECLLSVSDKVNKFVKTAEQVLSDAYIVEEKDRKIKEQHDQIMKQIVENVDDNFLKTEENVTDCEEKLYHHENRDNIVSKEEEPVPNKTKKVPVKVPLVKITTLRSSEAVKKAKALFENIATTTNKTKETVHSKTTKLTDIGVAQKKTKPSSDAVPPSGPNSTIKDEPLIVKQPTIQHTDYDNEINENQDIVRTRDRSPDTKVKAPKSKDMSPITRTRSPITREKSPVTRTMSPITREKSPITRTLSPMARDKSPASGRRSPVSRGKSPLVRDESPIGRTKSPVRHVTTTTTKKVLSRFPPAESNLPKQTYPEDKPEKPVDKVPGYQRPTKTSQIKEEKNVEEIEVSTRRGSGKFGVELRRTSADRSSVSSERRRSSDHHQPCIEDIFDLDLLEQMLEKVVGYEQRRRIRAQIRVAKKKVETEQNITRTTKQTTTKVNKTKSPARQPSQRSPDRQPKSQKPHSPVRQPSQRSPDRQPKSQKPHSPVRQPSQRSPDRLSKSQKPHSPERQPKASLHKAASPERQPKATPQEVTTCEAAEPQEPNKQLTNGYPKEPSKITKDKEVRPRSPEKPKSTPYKTARPSSPEKKTRPISPSKTATPKSKSNRFSEYASAYMKKVGLNENDKPKHAETKTKKAPVIEEAKTKRIETSHVVETHQSSKTFSERTSSKDVIEVIKLNGKKSPSPERFTRDKGYDRNDGVDYSQQTRKQSPERKPHEKVNLERKPSPQRKSPSPERRQSSDRVPTERKLSQRSPSPDTKPKLTKKETIIKTVFDIEKKIPQKQVQEEKPAWVMNRNLKKVTSETRAFSSKKIETEKPKYRPSSPSKAITKPIDVITSSYGPGPLDADGRPLFGIKALRNGATNYQVKGTVIRQEFHSKNGGEPEGTVSVTAYSTEPEDLEKLLQTQGERPSRLHGLAAITTTKKFGGDTGTTFSEITTKEERAALDQFTHSDRRIQESKIETHSDTFDVKEHCYSQRDKVERVTDGDTEKYGKKTTEVSKRQTAESGRQKEKEKRTEKMQKTERRVDDRKTVRQSSVKSLTEKFIKNASETSKTERSGYPKAGLILRTTSMKDSVSSDSSAHAGLARTDSDHSLASLEDVVTTTTREQLGDVIRTTTTTRSGGTQERSFLDSSTKVTGVQDILTRMKNADIVIEEGDTNEDSEARALLNKFLGATVLMAGMQNYVTEKPGGVVVRQETVQSHSSGGKVTSSRQLEEFDIEQCWDERVLRRLLDECTDYEVRRRLRARIRALMAEQEACASAVTEALAAAGETVETVDTEEQQQSGERGESLLLPLLQGLLQGGGERLLAGLGTASHDVVADVRRSLQRLRLALAPPADHPQARALLALADRLEDALDAADRLDGCKRKTRRRSRTARHTVGVTREELEEARRMVDRDTLLPEPLKPVTPTSSIPSSAPSIESTTPERKQSVDDQVSYHDAIEVRQKPIPVAHSASFESAPKINRDAHVVERRVNAQRRPDFFRHSIADSAATEPPKIATERWRSESKGGIAAIANKFDVKVEKEAPVPIKRAPIHRPQFNIQQKPVEEPRRSVYCPPPPTYNFAAPPIDDTKPLHRSNSNSKRLRMKRANTIDIGRPYNGYHFDNDADEDSNAKTPMVPEFRPQTENDKKFLAFMQKNEENGRHPVVGQANWSNRFGNIKNTFENREKEENTRSSSASSAKRFWQVADSSQTSISRPRKFLSETSPEIVKPPWVSQRRESLRSSVLPTTKQIQQTTQPAVPMSPTKPTIVKPFVAKPIPVNQFSHAPMSAFKPPQKILSPTRAPANVWSPPSFSMPVSPSVENPPVYQSVPYVPTYPENSSKLLDVEKQRQVTGIKPKYNGNKFNHSAAPKAFEYRAPTPPTHAHNSHSYPIQTIPSQNNLAAPQLVKKIDNTNCYRSSEIYPTKIDAQQLQIEFYEKQIREKNRRDTSSERGEIPMHKPPAPPIQPPYTIVDYTPVSTFVPLQQTPDIEKAKAHKVDYLPDVVINENNTPNYLTSPTTRLAPVSPTKPKPKPNTVYQNGDVRVNGDHGAATEHNSVVTKVMRGPVRGSATITAGVRTRGAADNLRGVLDKLSSPKHDVISQIEKKKRENRNQVRLAPPPAPGLSPSHATSPTRPHAYDDRQRLSGSRSPALAASRESIFSSESPASRGSSPGSALTRSGSWHRLEAPKASSPRKVVARTKSMHLLAVPKLFEGGISQDEVLEKKRTVEAYFSGQTSPNLQQVRARPARTQVQFALGRSRTMPTVSELQFLDESNADDAFEDLVSTLA